VPYVYIFLFFSFLTTSCQLWWFLPQVAVSGPIYHSLPFMESLSIGSHTLSFKRENFFFPYSLPYLSIHSPSKSMSSNPVSSCCCDASIRFFKPFIQVFCPIVDPIYFVFHSLIAAIGRIFVRISAGFSLPRIFWICRCFRLASYRR
jgi:hypothetical protein